MFMLSGASRQGKADGRLGISVAPASSPAAKPGDELHMLALALFVFAVLAVVPAAAAALEPSVFVVPGDALGAEVWWEKEQRVDGRGRGGGGGRGDRRRRCSTRTRKDRSALCIIQLTRPACACHTQQGLAAAFGGSGRLKQEKAVGSDSRGRGWEGSVVGKLKIYKHRFCGLLF